MENSSTVFPSSVHAAEKRLRRFRKSWGAEILDDGNVLFRIWAPQQPSVSLRLDGTDKPMAGRDDGWFETVVPRVDPLSHYSFVMSDGVVVPDPAARAQALDQHGPSVVSDPTAYRWQVPQWRGRPWCETVIYELHIGTFTPEGTFDAAAARLPDLAALGITAVEIMPVAHSPGDRNWGYDGVFPYAPQRHYGSPEAMKAFVDAAHRLGLMAFLDVVYNHFGPDGNYLHHYAPQFFHADRNTPWGSAIDYTKKPVRAFFIENALYWLEEFNLDGLRFDAIDSIHDEGSEKHVLIELSERVRTTFSGRHIHLMTEDARNITSLHERDEHGHAPHYDGEWNDDFHHVAHVIATDEGRGYYGNYVDDRWRRLARALAEGFIYQGEIPKSGDGRPLGEASAHLPPTVFINFIQNHDQIGNRAFGERLTTLAEPAVIRLLMALLLLSPQIPLLYMGEEYGETAPFLFFSDMDGALGESVREGRRGEAEKFGGFAEGRTADDIPDPLDRETFRQSRLDWSRRDAPDGRAWLGMVGELLALRHARIVPLLQAAGGNSGQVIAAEDGLVAVDWMLGESRLELRANFADGPLPSPGVHGPVLYALSPTAAGVLASDGELPARSILFALA